MTDHIVEQGDCLSSIAKQYGFKWQTLWNHPRNAELKRVRKDPNVLYPGDTVHIPDKELKQESCGTEKRHTFKRKGIPAKLRIRLLKDHKPRGNEPYTLAIEGKLISGKTDGDGWIEQFIPPDAREGKLLLRDGMEYYPLKLGHLDPINEISGIQARLKNLGFYSGPTDGEMTQIFEAALKGFQHNRGLPETGQPDQQTQAALKAVFGS